MSRQRSEIEQTLKSGVVKSAPVRSRRLPAGLIEVVVTALILTGAVAAIVPRMSAAESLDRSAELRQALQDVRSQIMRHRVEQGGIAPGLSDLSALPLNPISLRSDVLIIPGDQPFPTEPTGPQAWVYQPSTGTFAANTPGRDGAGVRYFDY